MSYERISYNKFNPFRIEKIGGGEIKKISWETLTSVSELKDFSIHFQDERTKVFIKKVTSMPFTAYVIPAAETFQWAQYLKTNAELGNLYNCVYLLFGHDFIYAGKSVNGDRILGHIDDEAKKGFDCQILFAPNNENPDTLSFWTSDFMAYLESLLIDRIIQDNPYCKNAIKGKNDVKCKHDLNLNEDKEEFAENVVSLALTAFVDITYSSYLLPKSYFEQQKKESPDVGPEPEDSIGMTDFWKDVIGLSKRNKPDNEFSKMSPSKYRWIGLNLGKIGKIPCSSIGCAVTLSTCRVELTGWGSSQCAQTNLDVFDKLYAAKDEIEREIGCALKWDRNEDKYTTRISVSRSLSFRNSDIGTKRDISDFFSEYVQKFFEVLPKYYEDGLESGV